MRKLTLLAVALVSLAVAVSAGAKTVTVTITKNGYVPSFVTLAAGDTIQFTNTDTVAHQVEMKPTTGVTCAPNPLVLRPAQSGSCTFRTAGKFTYSDPNVRGNTFRGSVTVTGAAETLTLAAKPQIVVYGGKTTLSGAASSQQAGQNVDLLGSACGVAPASTAASKVTTVATTTGGAFSALVQPLKNTAYTAKLRNTSSQAVTVKVRPRLRLGKVALKRYSLRVSAAQSFAGKYATFQRHNAALRRWVKVKRVLLRANSTGVAPTVVSSVTFRSSVPARLRVRVILPQLQVGSCYLAGRSNVIRS
jgi:plastocyanin